MLRRSGEAVKLHAQKIEERAPVDVGAPRGDPAPARPYAVLAAEERLTMLADLAALPG
ncbi:hypothetical protein ACLQ24_13815 [Micromonospora sp. DT4]|uniref:hypothetical protein n=1 Tax=Micromonospora sp. DT4 TaxID=3393438 RepID=UPI003CED1653